MNHGLINKPKGPGATRRVWEIADEITGSSGRTARRKDVIDAYVSEGGNANTASTQYYYWKAAQEAEADGAGAPGELLGSVHLRVDREGRLTLPAEVVRALRLGEDGIVSIRVEDGELRMIAPKEAVRKVQGLLAKLKRPGESVVDDFLAERRAMWGED